MLRRVLLVSRVECLTSHLMLLPSVEGDWPCEAGECSLVGEPASAMPSRLEMEGSEHFGSSMGGDGGG